ncbi:hypothetical protein GCM10017673_57640 [Streptosporangium violaceochromogenes]|nr:hypothetical protein GCM10017673_57640 [Streptosporangium violaceochromogenes]
MNDKGDTYNGRTATCGACGTTSTANPLDGHACTCGRVLNGTGRGAMPDLSGNQQ